MLGDIVGRAGRDAVARLTAQIRAQYRLDFISANGENAAHGAGIEGRLAEEIKASGVQFITLGDHTWDRKGIQVFLESAKSWCIRPANFPSGLAGAGSAVYTLADGTKIGIMNLIGRVFISGPLDCPFQTADKILSGPLSECKIILADVHAEATSEKMALARYLDGRVSLVAGTHTHVATADARILPGGTAYITDLGMCGSHAGVIGMESKAAIKRFLSGISEGHDLAAGEVGVNGVFAEIDCNSGKAITVERISAVL